jgi:hypothetical protein
MDNILKSKIVNLYQSGMTTRKVRNYYDISIGRKEEIDYIYKNIYKESSYFLERKYDKFLVAYSESCRATLRKFS